MPDWDRDDAATVTTPQLHAPTTPAFVSQKTRWFSWGWPWPRKGRRDNNDEEDPGSENPGDGQDDKPEEPVEPAKPPKDKEPKSHVPKPKINSECRDCFKWEFFDDFGGNGV